MKILLVDNFDSFTFNLAHYIEGLDCEVSVVRINEVSYEDVLFFDKIVISPGPGLPHESELLMKFIETFHDKKPILGVCLGMQALGEFFGDKLINLNQVKHGVSGFIEIIDHTTLFRGLKSEIEVGLYHSWAVELQENSKFIPLAYSKEKILMAFQHETLPLFGVQFHPESIMTPSGKSVLFNFLSMNSW